MPSVARTTYPSRELKKDRIELRVAGSAKELILMFVVNVAGCEWSAARAVSGELGCTREDAAAQDDG